MARGGALLPCTASTLSRFFRSPASSEAAVVNARLPRPIMTFYPPSLLHSNGSVHHNGRLQFLLLDRDKVLATDQMGQAVIYDARLKALRTAPTSSRPKYCPLSIAVGDRFYVLDSSCLVVGSSEREHCFEALVYERGGGSSDGAGAASYDDWRYHSLPAPPYTPGDISAYAVVGGSDLWVSTEGEGTYSFSTVHSSWTKLGEWSLPFRGLAEYVPEYKIWFGLGLSSSNEKSRSSNRFCALDLAAATRQHPPPVLYNFWEDLPQPKGWVSVHILPHAPRWWQVLHNQIVP